VLPGGHGACVCSTSTVRIRTIIQTVEVGQGGFHMAKPKLALVSPATVNRTVGPLRRPNAELRTREYLTASEVEALVEAAKRNRHGHRDMTMILLAYRHGLRAAEACDLRWDQVDFNGAVLHVRRVKNAHPAPILCMVTSSGPCVGSSGRARRRHSFSSARSRRWGSPG
jgi:integrase